MYLKKYKNINRKSRDRDQQSVKTSLHSEFFSGHASGTLTLIKELRLEVGRRFVATAKRTGAPFPREL